MFKLVDGSAKLGSKYPSIIYTKRKLFKVIKKHFTRLVERKDEDSKLFWATYSVYIVEDNKIYMCSRLYDVSFPMYDVNVKKSDETKIEVIPYKLDGVKEETINKLDVMKLKPFEIISPLEVMGWEEDLTQKWEGEVWMRGAFTGWNTIECSVDKELLNGPNYFNLDDYDEVGNKFRLESPNRMIVVTFELKYLHEEDCCDGYCNDCSGYCIEDLPEKYLDNEFRRSVNNGESRDYDYPEECFSANEVNEIIKLLLNDGYE